MSVWCNPVVWSYPFVSFNPTSSDRHFPFPVSYLLSERSEESRYFTLHFTTQTIHPHCILVQVPIYTMSESETYQILSIPYSFLSDSLTNCLSTYDKTIVALTMILSYLRRLIHLFLSQIYHRLSLFLAFIYSTSLSYVWFDSLLDKSIGRFAPPIFSRLVWSTSSLWLGIFHLFSMIYLRRLSGVW